jgi:hypothetical protein
LALVNPARKLSVCSGLQRSHRSVSFFSESLNSNRQPLKCFHWFRQANQATGWISFSSSMESRNA